MVATAPTGTVTFLFTDVEGSTRLWDSDSDGLAASLALHDQIMRRVIEAHREHVFSTAGDAFVIAFGSVGAAITAATAIQLQLLAESAQLLDMVGDVNCWATSSTHSHPGSFASRDTDRRALSGGGVSRRSPELRPPPGQRISCLSTRRLPGGSKPT